MLVLTGSIAAIHYLLSVTTKRHLNDGRSNVSDYIADENSDIRRNGLVLVGLFSLLGVSAGQGPDGVLQALRTSWDLFELWLCRSP